MGTGVILKDQPKPPDFRPGRLGDPTFSGNCHAICCMNPLLSFSILNPYQRSPSPVGIPMYPHILPYSMFVGVSLFKGLAMSIYIPLF